MGLFIDLTGRRFGRLLVLSRQKNNKHKKAVFLCRCSCGVEKKVISVDLRQGKTLSCSCLQKEIQRKRIRSYEERRKLSETKRGAKNPSWKGGIKPENARVRASEEYKNWRTAVFIRDGRKCQECGADGEINAHHLKAFSEFPELRFEVSNGQTLCVPCHKKTSTYPKSFTC